MRREEGEGDRVEEEEEKEEIEGGVGDGGEMMGVTEREQEEEEERGVERVMERGVERGIGGERDGERLRSVGERGSLRENNGESESQEKI